MKAVDTQVVLLVFVCWTKKGIRKVRQNDWGVIQHHLRAGLTKMYLHREKCLRVFVSGNYRIQAKLEMTSYVINTECFFY